MLGCVLLVIITLGVSMVLIARDNFRPRDKKLLRMVAFYHLFFGMVYYTYAQFNRSDSHAYYLNPLNNFRGYRWFDYFTPGTPFIEWVAWPFINFFGFSYEAVMTLFCFLGFLGFYFFFRLFKERIRFRHKFYGLDLLTVVMLLPNMHFWTASLGKGSLIFFGVGLFVWSVNDFRKRLIPLFIGAFIIYGIRVPILLVLVLGLGIGILLSSKGLGVTQKIIAFVISVGGIVFVAAETSSFLELDKMGSVQGYFDNWGANLSRGAGSGTDISNYNQLQKLFTFIYRPLFIDGRNALGLVVSVENVFYLLLTLQLFNIKGIKFLFGSDYLVKMSLIAFIGASFALAQICGNLGIAIRQKSQVMYLFLFVIMQYLDHQKMQKYLRFKRTQMRLKKLKQLENAA